MRLISQIVRRWCDQPSVLSTFFYRLFLIITQTVTDSRFPLHATGKFRRFWIVHVRKEYVQSQLFVRGGDCRQCGICCNLLFTCPMLTKQERCLIYGFCRPQACKVFPIDQRDIDEVNLCGANCGYRFDREYSCKIRKTGRS